MKCSNCGQEMIDVKEYCVRCGAKVKNNIRSLSFKSLMIIFLLVIFISVVACYLIINYNTDKEIEPFLNNTNQKTGN